MFNFLRNCQTVLQSGRTTCIHSSESDSVVAMHPYSHLWILFVFKRHSNRCVLVSQCGFNLHFSNANVLVRLSASD